MFRNVFTVVVIASLARAALAQSNVDLVNKQAWSENTGWTNWGDAGSPAGAQGVRILDTFAAGFVWAENAGWINLGNGAPANGVSYVNASNVDFGVNIDAEGTLHGLAWSENVGWINFDAGAMASPPHAARVHCDGRLDGMVWSENIGWINLESVEAGKHVAVLATAAPHTCDMNRDGAVNGLDIQMFVNLLMNGGASWRDICSGDVQASPDNQIDATDVPAFTGCVMGTP